MNRRILIQVTAPAAVIGLVLFGTCLVSAWIVNHLQTNRSKILSENVASLEAAQELEINVRKLRFLCFSYLIDPHQALLEEIQQVDQAFQESMVHAQQAATTQAEQTLVHQIEGGYSRYQREFERLRAEVGRTGPRRNFRGLADANPIRHVVEPCEELLRINKDMMLQTSQESDAFSRLLRLTLLLLGVGGPLSGLIIGYGMARGLSRSIYQLSVRIQDMAQHLEQDVASVSVAADGDLHSLDQRLQQVVRQVEEVTQRLNKQQRELLHAQQLSALGQLAAGVAHEIRNPLTSINMLVEAALRTRNPKPFTRSNLEVIHGEVARLGQTVTGFLEFARPPALRRSVVDLRQVTTRAVELVRARAHQQRVTIESSMPDDPVSGNIDPDQLCTVLVNLLINALDAMPDGGRLEISLKVMPGAGACLRVRDDGPGIAPEIADRLFTPFASTKPTGTGLGLSICKRIVEEHSGTITSDRCPEGGACFTITLPVGR
jgi:signal transduction histidine kinase